MDCVLIMCVYKKNEHLLYVLECSEFLHLKNKSVDCNLYRMKLYKSVQFHAS